MDMERNYFQQPTLLFTIFITVLFVIGVSLSFMAMTDFFTISPFERKNSIMLTIQVAALVTTAKVIWNYQKIKSN